MQAKMQVLKKKKRGDEGSMMMLRQMNVSKNEVSKESSSPEKCEAPVESPYFGMSVGGLVGDLNKKVSKNEVSSSPEKCEAHVELGCFGMGLVGGLVGDLPAARQKQNSFRNQ